MTEKLYGGASSIPAPKIVQNKTKSPSQNMSSAKQKSDSSSTKITDIDKLKQAGEISKKAKEFARNLIKKDMSLLEIADKIEAKIIELGGKPAFPVNLSINEIAAHYTPSFNDETKAHGLLKVDLGVQINGFCADTAFSIDLENSEENKKLIQTAEVARDKAISALSLNSTLRSIGKIIEDEIKSQGFQPIVNLSGHSIDEYNLHAGLTIPNYDNHQEIKIPVGTYAIEPFATTGSGKVIDGKPSGIYHLQNNNPVRDSFAREVLEFIADEYQTLPFCSRWLVKKFGTRALIALKRLEEANILHHYSQLIEVSRKPVAQAEHTIILTDKEKIITT